jgi:GDP-4-dehydro-6-deoxy-D-mannose reductase
VKVLVTGATGFVGRHLVAHLIAIGDAVVATDRSSGGPDITNAQAVMQYVLHNEPEVIYHLAGQSDVHRSWGNPVESYRANVEGAANVFAAAQAAKVRRVVAILSADAYGRVEPDDLPIDEQTPFRPLSPYAASKAAAEYVCVQAHLGLGVDVVRARPFTHIGPGQSPRFVAAALASRIAEAERNDQDSISVGRLDTRRDFTDVRDIVQAYALLARHGEAGEAYNVCRGIDVSIEEIAHQLVDMAKYQMKLVPDPALQRPADVPVLRGDATKLHGATGWAPTIPLEQTLHDMLEDWRRRLAVESPTGSPSHFD